MKLYLDNSVLNRPFDDQRQPRIWLETLSFGLVLRLIEANKATMIRSTIHELENGRNPFALRRKWVERCLGLAQEMVLVSDEITARAKELERGGLKPLDSLHLACALAGGADRFLTCDDRLLRRYSGRLIACNPMTLITTLQ